MLNKWKALLCLAPLLLGAATTAYALDFRITDSDGTPVPNARIIINNGPDAEPMSADMNQKNRQFQPQTLLVAKGSKVNFPNLDATQHHVYSFSPAKVFNLELFADRPEAPVTFDKTGVVEVGCNIHDQMRGFILVTDSALTAETGDDGMATIAMPEAMSNNELSVSLWHPRLVDVARTIDATVDGSAASPIELSLTLAPKPKAAGRLDGLQKRFQDL